MHPLDPIVPLSAQVDERFLHFVERVGPSTDEPVAMDWALDHEPSVLEDSNVALHRGERHRILGGEITHRPFASHGAGDDVASSGICERT